LFHHVNFNTDFGNDEKKKHQYAFKKDEDSLIPLFCNVYPRLDLFPVENADIESIGHVNGEATLVSLGVISTKRGTHRHVVNEYFCRRKFSFKLFDLSTIFLSVTAAPVPSGSLMSILRTSPTKKGRTKLVLMPQFETLDACIDYNIENIVAKVRELYSYYPMYQKPHVDGLFVSREVIDAVQLEEIRAYNSQRRPSN
jgi:hypothetical protein